MTDGSPETAPETESDGFDPELGFDPIDSGAEPARDDTPSPSRKRLGLRRRPADNRPLSAGESRPARPANRLGRKLSATAVLVGALFAIGGGYAMFASSSTAAASTGTQASIAQGRQLYDISCIACHGMNLQGVNNKGPTLIGVGGAATYFQVATGRMPAYGQDAEIARRTPRFDIAQTRELSAFVQSIGGGPAIPNGDVRAGSSTLNMGEELYSVNCASCHGMTFKGAPLSGGAYAPSLNASTDLEIYTAMLSGPENMPTFGDNQITPTEKTAIINYIQTIKASDDPGGDGIGRIGPVSEAIVIWVVGVGALMVSILWIGARAR